MAKAAIKTTAPTVKHRLKVRKRTSIGSGRPTNKHKRRNWKRMRGQGWPLG